MLKELQEVQSFQNFASSLDNLNENKKLVDFVGATMQRVTRRPLLLENICKGLQEFDAINVGEVEDMHDKVKGLTTKLNAFIKQSELDMNVVAQQLKPAMFLDEPGRVCLFRCRAKGNASAALGIEPLTLTLFLFNDCLLFAKAGNNPEQFLFQQVFPLYSKEFHFEVDMTLQLLRVNSEQKCEEFEVGCEAEELKQELRKAACMDQIDVRLPCREQRLSASALLSKIGVRAGGASPRRAASPQRDASLAVNSSVKPSQSTRMQSPLMRRGSVSSPSPAAQMKPQSPKLTSKSFQPMTPQQSPSLSVSGRIMNRASPSSVVKPPSTNQGAASRFVSPLRRSFSENTAPKNSLT